MATRRSGKKAKPKLGTGARFRSVERSAKRSGARKPAAVAAVEGRRKYGVKKMERLALAGKRRTARARKRRKA